MENIKEDHSVLLLRDSNDLYSGIAEKLFQRQCTITNKCIEEEFGTSTFDAVCVRLEPNFIRTDNDKLLVKILLSLKPGGFFIVHSNDADYKTVEFSLKANGFINITLNKPNSGSNEIISYKPSYQIGSSTKLTFKTAPAANVWKIDDTLDEDVETIDPDDLLDDSDFKKPDPSSLRVCGTTGKRKACKDCSCGLAEELTNESASKKIDNVPSMPKSSCGSCYLGDAFRCATCPYMGMPAFKPGEKIQLTNNELKSDI